MFVHYFAFKDAWLLSYLAFTYTPKKKKPTVNSMWQTFVLFFYKCNSEMFGDLLKVAQVVADKAGSGTRVSSSVGGYPFQDPCVSAFLL